ncbi:MAG: peptidylprolyl isomerase [Acidobacteria bacterium]|nr:peptidylprolyl isomerase [Acidobacteriota bacterium]
MTMLDTMRRHKGWLKWSLFLVVLTFIAFYIPTGNDSTQAGLAAPGAEVARVGSRSITVADFQRVYNAQMQAYRNAYGANMNDQLLKQLGLDRQILQQLVDEEAALAEAERLGLTASDAEVRERILALPVFQGPGGQFVGEDQYKLILRSQNPPLTTTDFEENIRKSIVLDKLRDAVTGWLSITDEEVDKEYRSRNEKVKVQLVTLSTPAFTAGLTATDAEAATYFEANKNEFRIGEKKKIKFAVIDVQKMREAVVVSPQDVERNYNQNIQQYTTPEQVRASHILLKTEGKDEAAVRAQAEQVLAQARAAGADFAALATKYSEDEASKAKGGDLDFFGRGRMVPEFEEAAFSLAPGTMSDLVKTSYGFHIIKVVEKQTGGTRALADVSSQITEQIKWERAQAQAANLGTTISGQVKTAADLDRVARANNLAVQDSEFFLRDEPIPGLGPSPEAAAEAFTLKEGEASGAIRVATGWVILVPTGTQAARIPDLKDVTEKVKTAVVQQKALAAARARAEALAATLKTAPDFVAAAKAAGFEAKTSELLARGSAFPDAGVSPALDAAAFALSAGAVSNPVTTSTGVVILKVTEKTEVTADQVTAGRDALRTEVLGERRGRFFSSYMAKAKEKLKITIDRDLVQKLTA